MRVAGVRVRAHCFSTCQGMFVCTLIAWKIVAAKINALPLIVYRCHGFIAHTKKLLLERSGKPPAQHSLPPKCYNNIIAISDVVTIPDDVASPPKYLLLT